ncbi:TlpA family protein disulfide reductase [Haloplanus halobius]|uniref:TlpA family protein disulfide reductase n=1 Tax=Haloplanus halobius TaxID=2934938 RepID=UPI00200C6860|nr:thioredoxin family protein [Haloplanus sp. XH21]
MSSTNDTHDTKSTEATIDRLVERGVFEAPLGDEVRPTAAFDDAVERYRQTLTDADDRRTVVASLTDDPETATALSAGQVTDPDFLARYLALRERDPDLSPARALALAAVIGQTDKERPPAEGAPEAFLPVDGADLQRLVGLYDRCVVYAWREDCTPCDAVRGDFDDLFADGPPDDLLPLAVYGPDCPRLLDREFDVTGAPTILFTLEGRVDSRFVGAPTTAGLRAEVETLRERTLPSER